MTTIEWPHFPGSRGVTGNPVTGCDEAGPECYGCYARINARRLKGYGSPYYQNDGNRPTSGPGFEVTCHPTILTKIVGSQPGPRARLTRTMFLPSMGDLFHPRVPWWFRAATWATMGQCPRCRFLMLTKRTRGLWRTLTDACTCGKDCPPGMHFRAAMVWAANPSNPNRIEGLRPGPLRVPWPLPNVWVGTSIGMNSYRHRADYLRRTPAHDGQRFLSLEPLLEPLPDVDVTAARWVIVGGESGHPSKARPLHVDWVRDIVRRCVAAGIPVFVKQLGTAWAVANGTHGVDPKGADMATWPDDLRIRQHPRDGLSPAAGAPAAPSSGLLLPVS